LEYPLTLFFSFSGDFGRFHMTRLFKMITAPFHYSIPDHSMNVKELGKPLYLDSGTLTPLLKRLKSKGLIRRARSSEDERVGTISVTARVAT
jgi:DNA-binding MarR family transcriptional regulator